MGRQYPSRTKAGTAHPQAQRPAQVAQTRWEPILQLQAVLGNQAVHQRLAARTQSSTLTPPRATLNGPDQA